MSEYTDLIREARETTERLTQPNLVDRLADALEASEAEVARLHGVIDGPGFDEWLTRHDADVRVEAGAAALEAFADSKWGQRLRGRLIVDAELSIRERAAALRSALEGEHTEPTIPPDDMWIKSSNDIRDRIKAAFTEPKLDPTPWFNGQATPQRSDHERYWDLFDPREWFSQDPAHYPGGTR